MENVGMKLSSPSRGFKHTSHNPHHEIAEPMERTSSVRRAVFMKKQGPMAPPLCTICKHKAPEFGKPVRKFTYTELSVATDSFNHHNYLAQGGYGSVYRGILPEGQLIAVKQHKIASSQGDHEFCAEVEVLSCAQHRNLVTLIGYCVENQRRLLVYEYVCNGSLDRHLSGKYCTCNRQARVVFFN
jgi:serine/threonine protein kinase